MEDFAAAVRLFLPDSALWRCLILMGIIIFYLIALRYLSTLLQRLTHIMLEKKQSIAQGWLNLIDKNKLLGNIFFAIGVALIAALSAVFLRDLFPKYSIIAVRVLNSLFIISVLVCANSVLGVLGDRYYRAARIPIRGIIQAAQVVFLTITVILVMSVMINKDPVYFIGGLTALSAVIMLVFKDSITGLTSGFQLLSNDLIEVGDWIEMSSENANGIVIDILLSTVRVQNWDNTIVNIPTYTMASSSFRNWRGMTEAGARRIQKIILIDVTSIAALTGEQVNNFKKFDLIKERLEKKEAAAPAGAGLTNLTLFRYYCDAYIKTLPLASKAFATIVHTLNQTAEGTPLEILTYTTAVDSAAYEDFQSELQEHLLTMAPQFNLKLYQKVN